MAGLQLNRRRFIRTAVIAGAGTIVSLNSPLLFASKEKSKKITILHTNDTHSRIEPFPMNGGLYQGRGGAAARATLINKIREEEKNVLLFDAGDIFQGTPYFNLYKGELEIELMNNMGYNASTFGNHEFDAGIESLSKQVSKSNFSFISSNYNFSNTPLEGKTLENKIFEVDGIKVGVYGLGIELNGLVSVSLYKETKYLDPLEVALEQEHYLKNVQKCNLIICLSHLGFDYETNKISDIKIAKNTKFTNLIIGGHTHTFLNQPEIVKNAINSDVYVNQVGWAGVNLGRLDFVFDKSNTSSIDYGSVIPIS